MTERPGELVESAHTRAAPAMGALVFMITKRQISRASLVWAIEELETALAFLRRALTSTGDRG